VTLLNSSFQQRRLRSSPQTLLSVRGHLWSGALVSAVFFIGVGGWASMTQIASAVIASGRLVVESDVKKVQHPTGGVVGELRVREGDHVTAGEVLIRLDPTQMQANLNILESTIDELLAERAREEAERDDAALEFPAELTRRAMADATIARLIGSERKLFNSRIASREGQKAQLDERIGQLREQVGGLSEQADAKRHEIVLIDEELKGVRSLWQQNLVPYARLVELERESARLAGEAGQISAGIAEIEGKVTETQLQIKQIDRDLHTEAAKNLSDVRRKLSEAQEKRIAAEDQLKRIDIRAPQDGVVHQLAIHTVGGLVMPGEPAMLIVPEADALVAEARIRAQDIDSVHPRQRAVLRFPGFDTRSTPEITGEVVRVAADVVEDDKTGASYYTTRISIPPEQRDRLAPLHLVPGMPIEAYFQKGERSVMSYLTKPLADQIAKTWRER
jgi:HlyD family secretion protein